MARRAPQQPAQHVASAFVAGLDAVDDHERDRAAVIGEHAERDVLVGAGAVTQRRQLFRGRNQAAQQRAVVVAADALEHRGNALETHPGVHVLCG